MYWITSFIILLTAVPGILGVLHTARAPKENRSISTVIGISLITLLSTGTLLTLHYLDLLF